MLMRCAHDIMIDKRAIFGVIFSGWILHSARFYAFHRFDPRCPSINANSAVLVEYPVKNIVVVTHRTNPTYHQFTALSADVGLPHLLMLVFWPRIAFEYCHCPRNGHRFTGVISDSLID